MAKYLNKSAIEWCDFTWNPLTGCKHGCTYCYARRIAENPFYAKAFPNKFEPTFHANRLSAPGKETRPSAIFVCSMADMYGDWVRPGEIKGILRAIKHCPWHTFLMLTKNGSRMASEGQVHETENAWYGQTSTGIPADRPIFDIPNGRHFISMEPLLGDSIPYGRWPSIRVQQVIIGAQTGPGAVKPRLEWVLKAIDRADEIQAKVFLKDNILKIYPDLPRRRELAWGLNE